MHLPPHSLSHALQGIAFVGGIDLCPGRLDTSVHALHDVRDVDIPASDFYNPRAKAEAAASKRLFQALDVGSVVFLISD